MRVGSVALNAIRARSMIEIVSATRMDESQFQASSALGISLRRLAFDRRLAARVRFANRAGLPEVYNAAIAANSSAEILVFMHDDVWLDDYFFTDRIIAGLQAFDVIGVAGGRRRHPRQSSWGSTGASLQQVDEGYLSGAVAHGKNPFGRVSAFGPAPAQCELLDGVLIAAWRSTLLRHSVCFDARFGFHFYDLDFCRTARAAGLCLGTWPIALTHQSAGGYESPAWLDGYNTYLQKWGE